MEPHLLGIMWAEAPPLETVLHCLGHRDVQALATVSRTAFAAIKGYFCAHPFIVCTIASRLLRSHAQRWGATDTPLVCKHLLRSLGGRGPVICLANTPSSMVALFSSGEVVATRFSRDGVTQQRPVCHLSGVGERSLLICDDARLVVSSATLARIYVVFYAPVFVGAAVRSPPPLKTLSLNLPPFLTHLEQSKPLAIAFIDLYIIAVFASGVVAAYDGMTGESRGVGKCVADPSNDGACQLPISGTILPDGGAVLLYPSFGPRRFESVLFVSELHRPHELAGMNAIPMLRGRWVALPASPTGRGPLPQPIITSAGTICRPFNPFCDGPGAAEHIFSTLSTGGGDCPNPFWQRGGNAALLPADPWGLQSSPAPPMGGVSNLVLTYDGLVEEGDTLCSDLSGSRPLVFEIPRDADVFTNWWWLAREVGQRDVSVRNSRRPQVGDPSRVVVCGHVVFLLLKCGGAAACTLFSAERQRNGDRVRFGLTRDISAMLPSPVVAFVALSPLVTGTTTGAASCIVGLADGSVWRVSPGARGQR